MRTLGSINHPGPDEVPIAILLQRTALHGASVGIDPIDRRPGPGGHPSRAVPRGTIPNVMLCANTRVGKIAVAILPTRISAARAPRGQPRRPRCPPEPLHP